MEIDKITVKIKVKVMISWWSVLKMKALGIGDIDINAKKVGDIHEVVISSKK